MVDEDQTYELEKRVEDNGYNPRFVVMKVN